MPFTPDLALGHPQLDRQHAELFRLLDEAAAAFEAGSTATLGGAVTAFAEALLEHTAAEEALMEESLYPDRGRHRVAHKVFLSDLQQLRAELAATGPTPQVGEWIRIRVPEWLRFHVVMNDTKLGAHLARRPASGRGATRADSRRTPRS